MAKNTVDSQKWPTVNEIAAKKDRGEALTAWEASVYLLNFRDDGTRYSSDPTERAAQYDADTAKRGGFRDARSLMVAKATKR